MSLSSAQTATYLELSPEQVQGNLDRLRPRPPLEDFDIEDDGGSGEIGPWIHDENCDCLDCEDEWNDEWEDEDEDA